MKLPVLFLMLLVAASAVGQVKKAPSNPNEIQRAVPLTTFSDSLPKVPVTDSLFFRRHVLTTSLYHHGQKATQSLLIEKLRPLPKAYQAFRISQVIRPAGAILAATGLAAAYLGIKGRQVSTMIRGKTVNSPEVQIEYTDRSLPKTLGGVGLFLGGLCLMEFANELTAKSVTIYNGKVGSRKWVAQSVQVQVGITTSGGVGLIAHL
jgi:hypothetical protein